MLRALILALLLVLASGLVLTPRAPAGATVRMDQGSSEKWKKPDAPPENWSNTPGSTPNFKGGSFADYLAAQKAKQEAKKK